VSTTEISFAAKLKIGEQVLPLRSEIVLGDTSSQDGVQNGFLFMLDQAPGDPPVIVNLGDVIGFVEEQLGAGSGSLASNSGVSALTDEFGTSVASPGTFNSQNSTLVEIREFTINSTTTSTLFSLNVDITSSDPTTGLIALPGDLANWVKIQSLAISFSARTGVS
jgi:hypothetical protein